MSIVRELINRVSEVSTVATSSSNTCIIDCALGTNFIHTLAENTTFTPTNIPTIGAFSLKLRIIQDSSASGYTFDWAAGTVFAGGTAPTLTSAAGAVDSFELTTEDGTTWSLYTLGQDMKV